MKQIVASFFLLLACSTALAQSSPGERIDRHIGQPRFAAATWGIQIVSLSSGRVVYAHDADKLLLPASTAKLFTAALALETFGADYRVHTQLLASGGVSSGKLGGSLVLAGRGDPTLGTDPGTLDWAAQLADAVKARGIREVGGDLIADDSYFATPAMGSGWEAIDLQSYFAATPSALSVGENVVDVTVAPAAVGRGAVVGFDPRDAAMPLVNRMTTTAADTRADLNLYRAPGQSTLHAFGTIAAHAPAQRFRMSVADPAMLAGERLMRALAGRGIKVDGRLRAVHWPAVDPVASRGDLPAIAEVLSPPLSTIVRGGLKRSQNLYLQNLLLMTGAKAQADDALGEAPSSGFVTTETWGIRALNAMLDRIGISPSATMLEEGTGLSRRDLTTAGALTKLLVHMDVQPSAAIFRDALPVAGFDGTMMWRMKGTPGEGKVQAKTGSMTLVHALAGYATDARGERYAFAVMLNNYQPPARAAGVPSPSADVDAVVLLLLGGTPRR
jgi:D-alanyl-D-alanine carboxypeptidase/D-alanyl-D-alanine-endopeptidase (penicillin-binding protein 4)